MTNHTRDGLTKAPLQRRVEHVVHLGQTVEEAAGTGRPAGASFQSRLALAG